MVSVYITIKRVSKMIIFTQLSKYFVKRNPQTLTLQGSSACYAKISPNKSLMSRVFIHVLCFIKLQIVFSTANFVYKFIKSENCKNVVM